MIEKLFTWWVWFTNDAYRPNPIDLDDRLDKIDAYLAEQPSYSALLDRIAALEDNQRAQSDTLALLNAELTEKQRPNVRHTPRNWSAFKSQVQGGGNAA